MMDHLPIYLGLGALCLNNFCQHVSLISLFVAFFFLACCLFQIGSIYSPSWPSTHHPPTYVFKVVEFQVHATICCAIDIFS